MSKATREGKIENRNLKIETRSTEDQTRRSPFEKRSADLRPSFQFRVSSFPFLLEVGCEEIPARFLRDAERDLGERLLAGLREARLLPEAGADREPPLQTYSTPRRFVVHVPALLARQADKVEEILGPPVKVAVDAAGKYTRAAESFTQKNSARLEDLIRVGTPKGEYLALRRTTQGRSAQAILPEILPAAILGLSFPKGMYWTAKSEPHFVRPIRWLLAIVGEGKQATAVEFEILGVKSGDFTFGHRARGHEPQPVTGFKDYMKKLGRLHVEIDPGRRRERVLEEAQALVQRASLKLVWDDWLMDWVVNSTEWPRPMLGNFDERFLHLPREILITVMRDHQKYFAVEDGQGNLRPHFVAVLNMDSDEKGLIRQGHERVLAARFRDAEFFWAADQKVPLDKRQDILERVTYQAELGSYGDKVRRMRVIASELCKRLGSQGRFRPVDTSWAMRAIDLCKCDLTTQMVQEFPELQGVVGGLYGKAQSESKEVYEAIYDHYLPRGAEDRCPRSSVGAVVSLADKFDSVVTGFAVGHEPTGSSDPFAIRRQGSGIVKVILEHSLPVSLKEIIELALYEFQTHCAGTVPRGPFSVPGVPQAQQTFANKQSERARRVPEFLAERLRYHLESVRGFRYDTVRAVLAAGFDVPADALARAEAVEALRGGEDFEALSVAAKRIRNILTKSATAADWQPGEVEAALLKEPQERELYDIYAKVAAEAGRRRGSHDYRRALEEISTLRPAVDRFFDGVLVMAESREVRQNRLRLLKKLDELFSGIAHFAEIV
jgi:glycyl-tRNA synthetase beta chain